jgi:hypothetical protein
LKSGEKSGLRSPFPSIPNDDFSLCPINRFRWESYASSKGAHVAHDDLRGMLAALGSLLLPQGDDRSEQPKHPIGWHTGWRSS